MRIIDVQQVLMQEPRVAFEEAYIISQAEFQKEIIRQKRIHERQLKRQRVSKIDSLERGLKVEEDHIEKNDRKNRKLPQDKKHLDIYA